MAVRKRAVVPPTEQSNAHPAELTNSSGSPDEELESNEDLRFKTLVSDLMSRRVVEEWLKGILAFPVAIAGVSLGWWVLKSNGFAYWFGTISGLVIMSFGMAYAVEFIKLLISGDLTKATSVLMKGFEMKEWMRVVHDSHSARLVVVYRDQCRQKHFRALPFCVGASLPPLLHEYVSLGRCWCGNTHRPARRSTSP